MPATQVGNEKVRQTMHVKFGGCEVKDDCDKCVAAEKAFKEHMAKIGAKGGKAMVPKGKALNPEQKKDA